MIFLKEFYFKCDFWSLVYLNKNGFFIFVLFFFVNEFWENIYVLLETIWINKSLPDHYWDWVLKFSGFTKNIWDLRKQKNQEKLKRKK